ncbi:MAG: hypothetical protein IH595_12875 [Bacteroidales bacterium]|nr:hypothetical protein [Bacteroidales bacterium]
MNEKVTFQFSHSLGIFFKHYYGNITLEDIISSWENIIDNHLIPAETKGFVLDYRNAIIKVSPGHSASIANFYKSHLEVFNNLKIAILTDKPENVVISILVESKDEGYQSKPFSTMEAAVRWVLS